MHATASPVAGEPISEQPSRHLLSGLGWGFYLASSWTWVIGMFLPVLLVRDYGTAGWLTFAIPNVIGAAAMGWILRTREAATDIITRHRTACEAFSLVTISFQVFVLLWLLPRIVGEMGLGLILLAMSIPVFPILTRLVGGRAGAVICWLISAAVFATLWLTGVLQVPAASGVMPTWHLVGLAPASILGFLLCPYLDLTFLHAREQTSRQGARIAFAVGFGLLFLAMILFTWLYAVPVTQGVLTGAAAWLLATHLTVQISFTLGAHAHRLGRDTTARGVSGGMLLAILTACTLAMFSLIADARGWGFLERGVGEQIYRVYMGFYGLIFPAYVLLVMVRRRSLTRWAAACLLALPFLAVGFLSPLMPLTALGIAVVLLIALAPQGKPA